MVNWIGKFVLCQEFVRTSRWPLLLAHNSSDARLDSTDTESRVWSVRQTELSCTSASFRETLSQALVPVGRLRQPDTQVLPDAGMRKLTLSFAAMRPCRANTERNWSHSD